MTDLRRGLLAAALATTVVGCSLAVPAGSPGPSSGSSASPGVLITPSPKPHRTARPTATPVVAATPTGSPDPLATPPPTPIQKPTPPPDATPTPNPGKTPFPSIPGLDAITGTDGRFTVLLLGSDARKGLSGERTDVIMVATIDPATGNVALVSLPRDMRDVPYGPGLTYPVQVTGLFQSFELQGMSRTQALNRMKKAMSYAFGIEIDYYAITKFTGVVNLINTIGGVNVTLAAPFVDPTSHLHHNKGIHMHKGVNHLDGGEALAFARSRHTTSDYDRSYRQHVLIEAVTAKVRQMGIAAILPLAKLTFQQLQTDIPASALPQLYALAQEARINNAKSIVLGPSKFASAGSILYSIYIKLDAVRATFQKIFSH